VTCAQEAGLCLHLGPELEGEESTLEAYCHQHTPRWSDEALVKCVCVCVCVCARACLPACVCVCVRACVCVMGVCGCGRGRLNLCTCVYMCVRARSKWYHESSSCFNHLLAFSHIVLRYTDPSIVAGQKPMVPS
jgi:hypothetical protein